MKLLTFPNKMLQTVCQPYKFGKKDDRMRMKTVQMFEIMKKNNGVGLSACQVGWPVRIFVLKTEKMKQVFVNPEIISVSDDLYSIVEGCLSFPDTYHSIERPSKVTLKYQDTMGNFFEGDFEGLEARIILHECDHMEGITFESR